MQVKGNTAFTQYNVLTQKPKMNLMTSIYNFIEFFFHITFVIWKGSWIEVGVLFIFYILYFLTIAKIYLVSSNISEENSNIDKFFWK